MKEIKGLKVVINNPEHRSTKPGKRTYQPLCAFNEFMRNPNHMTTDKLFESLMGALHKEKLPNGDIVAFYEFGEDNYECDYIQRTFGYHMFITSKNVCTLNDHVPDFKKIWESLNTTCSDSVDEHTPSEGLDVYSGNNLPKSIRFNY